MFFENKNMRLRSMQVDLYTDSEYQRRWEIARSVIRDKNADLMLILDCAREGYDTWFSGRKMVDTIIVPLEGDITAFLHREFDESCFDDISGVDYSRYTKQKKPDRELKGLAFKNLTGPDAVVDAILSAGAKRICLINSRLLTHSLKTGLEKEIPGLEIIDAKYDLDRLKIIKSTEELESIRYAAAAHEQLIEALKFIIRPGKKMSDINSEARKYLMGLGAYGDMHAFIAYLGKQDVPSMPPGAGPADPVIEYGDRFLTIYESNGYGGHHIAMGRNLILGKAGESYRKAIEFAAELNLFAASQMKPGNTLGNIRRATEKMALDAGTRLTRMCWMHGLNTDGYFEQFALNDYGMEWPITEGAVLHCHPVSIRKMPQGEEEAFLLNTYLVTKDGGKSLVDLKKRPFDIVEID
ncbi:MAG: M24 family metallopeptidase [Clostridia bacterium]|nr:M24 family metallopeptidase [Clostridia bacterium]